LSATPLHLTHALAADGSPGRLPAGYPLDVAFSRVPGRNEEDRKRVFARLLEIWRHLQTAPAEQTTLAQLAAVSGYSPWHVQRLFKHVFGIAPHTVAVNRKLEMAAALLARTDQSMVAICARAGFVNRSAFCRLFHSKFGITPAVYRSRARRTNRTRPTDSAPSRLGPINSVGQPHPHLPKDDHA
jgi:AraC-like DNA-binding protein